MLISTEFNGDMYYEEYGQDVIESLNNINDEKEYKKFIKEFNKENFRYNGELIYRVEGDEYERYLNMSDGYIHKWFSDYIYVKNLSDEIVVFIDDNKYKCSLEPNKIGVFYFGEIATGIKENKLTIIMDDVEDYIQSLGSDK